MKEHTAMKNTNTEDMHIKTYRERFEKALEKGRALAAPYAEKSPEVKASLDRFERLCSERLKDLNPKLMVYGIYNAGKSTLVNALMGGEYAPVGDVPTTKAVNAYDWREYTVYDTPGINAPEKDEAVSKEQLLRSDVILFVMDTAGDFSLAKNYRELADIAKSGKRLLIVLNDKLGLDFRTQADEISKIESRVYEDFASLMEGVAPEELAKRFRLVTVNARRALQARLRKDLSDEKRAVLVRASNIEALEASIVEEYEKASGLTVLAQLATMFESELDSLARRMGELQQDVLARRGQESLEELHAVRERIRNRVADYAHDREAALRDAVRGALENAQDEASVTAAIQKEAGILSDEVARLLTKECEAAALRCEAVVGRFESYAVDMKGVVPEGVSVEAELQGVSLKAPATADGKPIPGVKSLEATALLKGVQPLVLKAFGKAAAKFVGRAIPVINIALIVWDVAGLLFGESAAEKEQKARYEAMEAAAAAEERRQREIARWRSEVASGASRASRSIVSDLLVRIDGALDEAFAPAVSRVNATIEANRSEESRLVRDLSALAELKAEISRF